MERTRHRQFYSGLRAFVLIPAVLLLIGCVSQIDYPPNSAAPGNLPVETRFNDIKISANVAHRLSGRLPEWSRPFRQFGLLVIGIRFENYGKEGVIIERKDIGIKSESGRTYRPLDEQKITSIESGLMGRLFMHDFSKGIARWGIDKSIFIRPKNSISGYLVYDVGRDEYDQMAKGVISVIGSRVRPLTKSRFDLRVSK